MTATNFFNVHARSLCVHVFVCACVVLLQEFILYIMHLMVSKRLKGEALYCLTIVYHTTQHKANVWKCFVFKRYSMLVVYPFKVLCWDLFPTANVLSYGAPIVGRRGEEE